jgi:capsular exopolysaccharide synthesis family protein
MTTESPAVTYEPLVDLRGIFGTFYRNRWILAAVLLASLSAGALYVLLKPKLYEATAKLQIGIETPSPLVAPSINNSLPQDYDRSLQTQMDLLDTNELAVLARRQLASDPRTAPVAQKYTPQKLRKSIDYLLPKTSRVVSINARDQDPATAAAIANAYAEALIYNNLQSRSQSTAQNRDYLAGQLKLAKDRLEQSERAVVQYARAASVLDPTEGVQTGPAYRSLTAGDLVQINNAYSTAKAARIQAQQRWQQAAATSALSLPEVLANSAVQELLQQRALNESRLQENRLRYGDQYPAVAQANTNIAALDRQIGAIAGNIRNSLREQYLTAARQEQALAGTVGGLKGATLDEQDRSVRYNVLKREADTNRELYDALLQRYKQVSAEVGLSTSNIVYAERARAPEKPVAPRPLTVLVIALVAGIILGVAIVIVREGVAPRVSDPDDLAKAAGLPLVGVVPDLPDSEEPGDAILDPSTPIAESAHSIRTALQLRGNGGEPRSLLLTSTMSGEGKSTTALALARAYADAGERVLLIDGDLRRPTLHLQAGVDGRVGFADVLAGRSALADVIGTSGRYGIHILPAGALPESPAAVLRTPNIQALLQQAAGAYDRVIIDGPPTLGMADAALIGAAVEGTLFLVKSSGVTRQELQVAIGRLRSGQVKLVGAVLTMYEAHLLNRGYSYRYGYTSSGRQPAAA